MSHTEIKTMKTMKDLSLKEKREYFNEAREKHFSIPGNREKHNERVAKYRAKNKEKILVSRRARQLKGRIKTAKRRLEKKLKKIWLSRLLIR